MYRKTVLSNGLRVLGAEMPHARSVAVAVFLGAGSRLEASDESGISHFIEHMLFKGTEKRPTSREISEAIERVGGIINAETSKELTVYWVKVARAHWRLAIDVLCDLLLNSSFRAEEIEKERRVVTEELRMLEDEPGDLVHTLVDEVMWKGCSLAWDIAGTIATVQQMSRDAMLRYLQQYYVPQNALVSVAGAVNLDEVLDEVGRQLGDWPAMEVGPWIPAALAQDQPQVRVEPKRTAQEHMCLAAPALTYTHPDRYALDLLSVMLGEGMSSRLFLELRDRRGLAYDVHSYVNYYRDTGSAVIYAGVEPRRAEKALAAILEQLDGLLSDGLQVDELGKAKEFWKGRMVLSMEDTHSVATWLGAQQMLLGQVRTVEEVMESIDSVTAKDVLRVGRDLFRRDALKLVAVGPARSGDRLRKLLSP